jgi:two-component system cell cycle response regulator DivK
LNHSIRVIAQTSFAMEGEKEKCLMDGCGDYLAKPLNINELLIKYADILVDCPIPLR